MFLRLVVSIIFFSFLSTVYGALSTWPAPIPLYHKSPYFNAWVNASTNLTSSPAERWSLFFHQSDSIQWFIGIRVDNTSYQLLGEQYTLNYTFGATVASYITSSQTRFTMAAGPVSVNLTFLTPIELQDWALHSFPFSYTAIDIASSDGADHAIQVYFDISFHLSTSDITNVVTWNTSFTDKSVYHMGQRQTIQTLTERNDMAEDGHQVVAYSATPGVSMTWQTCSSMTCRGNFTSRGMLENSSDTDFRILWNRWPVQALALDLGNIRRTSKPLVFGLGLIRDPVLSYLTGTSMQNLSHLWYSKWGNIGSAVDGFLAYYPTASSQANALDDRIQHNASALASQLRISTSAATNLVDLHILNLRQTVGSLEFTTSKPGKPMAIDDVRVFMKDVGYSRRTNPVEIIYASFPAFLYLNATVAGKLLEPLLEFQASSWYTNNYAAPDLGGFWPIIQGNTTDQSALAIDSCGAMLIMALAHARKSGDGKLLFSYYALLQKWADYLVQNIRHIGSYMSSDGLYTSNANLALKGITGLYAMGKINQILEARGADSSKTSYYLDTAKMYANDWLNQAVSSDHIMTSYGANSTWAMVYNLFAPRLLGATIIPEKIYETQASWYLSRSATAGPYGFPYDTTQSLVKAHWSLLSASSVFNATTSGGRDSLVNMVHSRSFWQSATGGPNPATYSTDGTQVGGSASPAMGAVYSFLALNLPDLTITLPSGALANSQTQARSKTNVPVIVGATFGAIGGLVLLGAVVFILRRRRKSELFLIQDPIEEIGPGSYDITLARQPISSKSLRTSNLTDARGPVGPVDGSSSDGDWRGEMEQLRRVVETLSAQQALQPQAHHDVPDEPPPMYPSEQ